jgi:hypothetical protein
LLHHALEPAWAAERLHTGMTARNLALSDLGQSHG